MNRQHRVEVGRQEDILARKDVRQALPQSLRRVDTIEFRRLVHAGTIIPLMYGLFLSCCLRGMEMTRHFTPDIGQTILLMLVAALIVAGLLLIALPMLRLRGSQR
jgi:Mg/Co/Ni transporter MgtE